jgi:hypothetical protein
MRQNNSTWRLPDVRVMVRGRLNAGHVTNIVAPSIEAEAASFPPCANARMGRDER